MAEVGPRRSLRRSLEQPAEPSSRGNFPPISIAAASLARSTKRQLTGRTLGWPFKVLASETWPRSAAPDLVLIRLLACQRAIPAPDLGWASAHQSMIRPKPFC